MQTSRSLTYIDTYLPQPDCEHGTASTASPLRRTSSLPEHLITHILASSSERVFKDTIKRHEAEQAQLAKERKDYINQWFTALAQWPGLISTAKARFQAEYEALCSQQQAELDALSNSLYVTDYKPSPQKGPPCLSNKTHPAQRPTPTKPKPASKPPLSSKSNKAALEPIPYGYFPKDPSIWSPQHREMLIQYTLRRYRGTAAMSVIRPDLIPKWTRKPPTLPEEPYKLAAAASSPMLLLPKPWQETVTALFDRLRQSYAAWKWQSPGTWPAHPSKSFLAFVHGSGVKQFEHEEGDPMWELKRQPPGRLKLFQLEEDVMDDVIQKYWTTS